ncbi:MAG TPA: glycosyltransferase family 2 protein [Gammaproteobacteria bacterium]|nr:glycosyltransferase family 2 protein [Gammaproteobacteria bacterium]
MSPSPEISVCVCTYRRPEGLRDTLRSLGGLAKDTPAFEIVVVDNDPDGSGERGLEAHRDSEIPLSYFVEPEKNIARARNRAVAEARAELIALIDDDEIAAPNWLAELYRVMRDGDADAVFGPVVHRYVDPPPPWLLNQTFFDHPVTSTGSEMPRHLLRSGNVLFRKDRYRALTHGFDEDLGLSGGEDTDLFVRMRQAGARLVSAEDAIVYESVPKARMQIGWLVRRRYRMGIGKMLASRREREPGWCRLGHFCRESAKACVRLAASAVWLPFSRGRSAKNFLKATYSLGVCAGFFGLRYYEYR